MKDIRIINLISFLCYNKYGDNMNLSKSRYCLGIQCKKILWLYKNKPEVMENLNNESVFETGNMIHEVARYLFGEHINIEFNENLEEMINNTYLTIDSYKDVVITEASFKYLNNFCSVDILVKKGNTYELYEVKSSTELKDIYIKDISYQYYVLTSLGMKVSKCSLLHLNSDYVRHGNLELDKLFIFEDVTSSILEMQDEVKSNIKDIDKYMEKEVEEDLKLGEYCFKPYPCPFFKYCSRLLDKPNIFDIASMRTSTKLKYYDNGITSFKDLINEDIKEDYKMQIEYELNDLGEYIDKKYIKEFLSTLTKPLYFLDFETFQMPIPLYDDVSPYEQIPFQYSLHYIDNDKLYHKEYLAMPNIDPRRELADKLVNDIPLNVCTLAYNMSFEKTVIKKLAKLFPDLHDHLMNIHDNIKDLMIPFKYKKYYNKAMKGSYSIKYVLPALFPNDESLNYHNLDLIHNGSEAMNAYANMGNLSKEELEYTRERLLRYCELDTYAMVKIYEKLIDVTEDKK